LYEKELNILIKKNRFRERKIYKNVIDLASNDYLCLAENKKVRKKAFKKAMKLSSHSSKASLLVNGYNETHKLLENYLKKLNNFEEGVIVGSGFLANLSLFELVRKKDLVLIDEEYHASGIVGSKLTNGEVRFFKHNDIDDFLLKSKDYKKFNRVFTFSEGIFSMKGDLLNKDIANYSTQIGYLVIDEAHSVGVRGNRLLGISEEYNLNPFKTIKMGTLGKALGSYGAYILANKEIIDFLLNKARSIIYTTALSPVDTLLAYYSIKEIQKNLSKYKSAVNKKMLLFNTQSLIKVIEANSNKEVIEKQKTLLKKGVLIGAIRQPTVKKPIFRIILRKCVKNNTIKEVMKFLNEKNY